MREVSYSEYLEYASRHRSVVVEGQEVRLEPIYAKRLAPSSEELTDVSTTVWSFPARGSWATHRGDYRGNWAPQIPRALILMYTEPGDVVLDPMVGSGTTCIEARLLGRNCIGVDISYQAVILTLHRLYWLEESARKWSSTSDSQEAENVLKTWSRIYHGDARELAAIANESIDLVATHPPYWNIIEYSKGERQEGDLSRAETLEEYLDMLGAVAREAYRVLKPGRYMGVLIGDTRVGKHYVPVSHYALHTLLKAGFILKEEVIKIQHKMKTTREVWVKLKNKDFLLIHHEKLYVLRKPHADSGVAKYKYSTSAFLNHIK